jgi:hypothetical protein
MTALHTAVRAAVRAARRAAGRGVGPAAGRAARSAASRAPGWASGRAALRARAGTASPQVPRRRRLADAGMTTAEYAVGTLAACAFAAVLIAVVRSGAIKSALSGLITTALSIAS